MKALWAAHWPLWWRWAVPFGVGALLIAFGLAWRVWPIYREWQTAIDALPAVQARYQQAWVELQQQPRVAAALQALEQQLTTQGGVFPLDALPLEALHSAAQAQGLQVQSVRWLPRQTERWPFSQALQLHITGRYADFLPWLQCLERWPGVLGMQDVQIRPQVAAGDALAFSLQLRFYQPWKAPSVAPIIPPFSPASARVPNPFFRHQALALPGWRWVGVMTRGAEQYFLFDVDGRSQMLPIGAELADSTWLIAALREGQLWLRQRDEPAEQRMIARSLGAWLDEAGSAKQ